MLPSATISAATPAASFFELIEVTIFGLGFRHAHSYIRCEGRGRAKHETLAVVRRDPRLLWRLRTIWREEAGAAVAAACQRSRVNEGREGPGHWSG